MSCRESAFEAAVDRVHAILNDHLSGLSPAERQKKWAELEEYLRVVAPDAFPEGHEAPSL